MLSLDEVLTRGVAEVIVAENLRKKVQAGQPLRLKLGIDPTRSSIHIGHAVALRKLRQFQNLGHTVVLIIGDWTAQIGDPTGRDDSRPRLSAAETKANAEHYMEQLFKIIDEQQTEIRWQSEWFGSFDLEAVFNVVGRFTMAQMLAHETFRQRYEAGQPLTVLELMYPMLQAYDSVAIQADVEFGGTDQKFNILAGRQLMEQLNLPPQEVLLVPLIAGTDGRKMSKTFDNTVDILMAPQDKYGRIMSMADDVLPTYYEVWTDVPMDEVRAMQAQMQAGTVNPRDLKMRLAREIITQIDGPEAAAAAEDHFVQVFQRREIPADMPEHTLSTASSIIDVLAATGLTSSKGEARRLITGGGVRVDGEKVEDQDLLLEPQTEHIVQVGRRKFIRLRGA